MEFRVLGPLAVVDDRPEPLTLGPYKWRLLLAALLCRPNTVVSGDTLAHALWHGGPPPSAAGTIRVYVHQLRQVVGARRIVRAVGGYQLVVRPGELDSDRFRELIGRARRAASDDGPARAAELFRRALALWRGPAFSEFQDADFIRAAAAVLDESRLDVLEECVEVELALGRHAELCRELKVLAAEHPLRENLRAQLMIALVRSGRQAEATAAFHETRRQLADEYGLDPGPRLLTLHRQILNNDPRLAQPQPITPLQLPGSLARFAGRADLLTALDARLPENRSDGAATIVTIVGMAGVGKTTLAVHWAHRVAGRFPDGQLFVNLRGFGPGAPVLPIDALAGLLRGLGVAPEAVPSEVDEAAALYRSVLAGRRVLVVLDNAGAVEQVRPLLPGSDGCLVLVTSRYRLSGLTVREGACRLTVDVLSTDEAYGLLVGLLGHDRPGDPAQALKELAQVCGHLPLALRIAAAQLLNAPFRSVAEQVELVRTSGLHSMSVDGDEETAVRSAFDASYASLPSDVRGMFRLLGLLPVADLSVEAAASLAGVPIDEAARLLDRLTGACLLTNPAAGRYTSHDLLRRYAAEHAGTEPAAADAFRRFCDWYLHSVDAAVQQLFSHALRLPLPSTAPPGALRFHTGFAAREWLDAERSNLLALIRHCAEHGPGPVAWLLTDALRGVFERLRHTVEWIAASDAGLVAARREGDDQAAVAMLHSAAHASFTVCRYSEAVGYLSEAGDLARRIGWQTAELAVVGDLGTVQYERGELVSSGSMMKRALRLPEQLGMAAQVVNRRSNLCYVQWRMGLLRKVVRNGLWALELARRAGHLSVQASIQDILGRACGDLGMPDQAMKHLRIALDISRDTGYRKSEISVNLRVALIEAVDHGRPDEGRARSEVALAHARDIADPLAETEAINTVAAIRAHLGHHDEAAELYDRSLSMASAIGTRPPAVEALIGLATAHRRLVNLDVAQHHAEAALAEASASFMAVHRAQAGAALAEVELHRGNHAAAAAHARQALRVSRWTGHRPGETRARAVLAATGYRRSGSTGSPTYQPAVRSDGS